MNSKYIALMAFAALANHAFAQAAPQTNQEKPLESSPQPAYQPPDAYVPHATYPYSDTYPTYDSYIVPAYPPASEYMTTIMPAAQTALQVALRIFAKIGLFLFGGVALLVVGGIFTTAVCSLTPFCTITFAGINQLAGNKGSMRSYVTPDKISAAANFVQDAIGKYQRLQRAVGN